MNAPASLRSKLNVSMLRTPVRLHAGPHSAATATHEEVDGAWLTVRFLSAIGPATQAEMPASQALLDRASPV
jgi:hypothetical protein